MSSRAKIVLAAFVLLVLVYVAPRIAKLFRDTPSEILIKKVKAMDTNQTYDIKQIAALYSEANPLNNIDLLNKIRGFNISVDTGKIIRDDWSGEIIGSRVHNLVLPYRDYADESHKYVVRNVYEPTKHPEFKKAAKIKRETGWDEDVCLLVSKGKIKLGMNKEQVVKSWGRPEDINRTTYAFGVHEQWVYEYNYVYFENGIVTTIQN
jgi:hypothetical protein